MPKSKPGFKPKCAKQQFCVHLPLTTVSSGGQEEREDHGSGARNRWGERVGNELPFITVIRKLPQAALITPRREVCGVSLWFTVSRLTQLIDVKYVMMYIVKQGDLMG